MDERDWLAERFEAHRSHLRAVAYRMLGSLSEADDAVQDAWLRLSRADTSEVDNLRAWLTTIVARSTGGRPVPSMRRTPVNAVTAASGAWAPADTAVRAGTAASSPVDFTNVRLLMRFMFFVSAWILMLFAGALSDDVGIEPFGYVTSMAVTIALWLTVAPAIVAVSRSGKGRPGHPFD